MATTRWDSTRIVREVQAAFAKGLKPAATAGRQAMRTALRTQVDRQTGDLEGAIGSRTKSRAGKYLVVDVGIFTPAPTDREYPGEMHAIAVRIDRGYVGVDALGRLVSQPARPFMAQARRTGQPEMVQALLDAAKRHGPKASSS